MLEFFSSCLFGLTASLDLASIWLYDYYAGGEDTIPARVSIIAMHAYLVSGILKLQEY